MPAEFPATRYFRQLFGRSDKPRRYTAKSVLKAYKAGRRCFDYARLDGENLCLRDLRGASFCNASMTCVNLGGALLNQADFSGADLRGASFREACVHGARFVHAKLDDACLYHTWFMSSDFSGASFKNADIKFASLRFSDFSHVDFEGARMTGVQLDGTIFYDADIRALCSAKRVSHLSPSCVDARTIMRSYSHPRLPEFLAACGTPDIFATYMVDCARAIGEPLLHKMMQSTFISYGAPDEKFARKIYEALRSSGVTVFFFPESASPGMRVAPHIFDQIQQHDRILLVCSKNSLSRPGLLNEVRETLDREAREGGASYLLPIMLDDYVLRGWRQIEPRLAECVSRRVIADFRGTRNDRVAFNRAMNRIVDALKVRSPAHSLSQPDPDLPYSPNRLNGFRENTTSSGTSK